jgi:hypothetical protein
MERVAKHAKAESSGKSGGFAEYNFCTGLADRLIEDRWKKERIVMFPLFVLAELIQYSQGMLHVRECGPVAFTGRVNRCKIVSRSLCAS